MPDKLVPHNDLASVRLLSCDIDGVLTDGGLYYVNDGTRFARFHVLDGMGLKRVQAKGVKVAFISQSNTDYIGMRAKDLGVDYCYTSVEDKLSVINGIIGQEPFGLEHICHIADDINDLELMRAVGVPVTVPGGVKDVFDVARFVTCNAGGNGAVRELCDAIIASKVGLPLD